MPIPAQPPPQPGTKRNPELEKQRETHRMKRLIIAALMAAFALTAFAATASAAEKTLILAEPTAAKPLSFTAKSSTEGVLEQVNGKQVKCPKSKGAGSFTTPNLGTGSVLFEGCTGPQETICTGEGKPAGTIEQKGEL